MPTYTYLTRQYTQKLKVNRLTTGKFYIPDTEARGARSLIEVNP